MLLLRGLALAAVVLAGALMASLALHDRSRARPSWLSGLLASCCNWLGAPRGGQQQQLQQQDAAGRRALAPQGAAAQLQLLPSVQDMLRSPQAAAWVQMAGGVWISQLLSKLWPFAAPAVEAVVKAAAPELLEEHKPAWMEGIALDRFSLGGTAPTIKQVHVDQINDDGIEELRLLLEVEWQSDLDCQLTVKPLPASLNKAVPQFLRRLTAWASLTCGVQRLSVSAKVMVMLAPLAPALPVAQAAQVSLLAPPELDFDLTITKGEAHVLNVLRPWLKRTIALAFLPFVCPEHICVPIQPGVPDVQKPEGILLVRVVRARELPVMDLYGHCDTYVRVWVRPRVRHRTPTVPNTAVPEFPQDKSTFQLLVHTRQFQVLVLELWDEDRGPLNPDDFIGTALVPLARLEPGKQEEMELQVQGELEDATKRSTAYAGATSSRGAHSSKMESTRLSVSVMYLPASMADPQVVGEPGVLNLKLGKVTLPVGARAPPLRARASVTRQPSASPALSKAVKATEAPSDEGPSGGQEGGTSALPPRHQQYDFENWDAVWDVVGSAQHVAGCSCEMELVAGAGTLTEAVWARIEVALQDVLARPLPNLPFGTAGGQFKLSTPTTSSPSAEVTFQLLWNPLFHARPGSADDAGGAAAAEPHGG